VIRRQTVALVGHSVVVSGSTAAALHRFLTRATAGQQVRPDVADLIDALGHVRGAWEQGVLSGSGHADVREEVDVARSEGFGDEVTTAEAGILAGLSPRSAQRLATSGKVASRRVGQSLLLSRSDLLAWIEERRDAEAG
jgi:hypothetical protein